MCAASIILHQAIYITALYVIPGPLASALSAQFGYRPVAMAGGLISAVGFLGASFSPNVEVLIALYGGLGGKF